MGSTPPASFAFNAASASPAPVFGGVGASPAFGAPGGSPAPFPFGSDQGMAHLAIAKIACRMQCYCHQNRLKGAQIHYGLCPCIIAYAHVVMFYTCLDASSSQSCSWFPGASLGVPGTDLAAPSFGFSMGGAGDTGEETKNLELFVGN